MTDTAGNANAQTDGPTVTVDRTGPTATIDLQAGSDTGTSNSDNITKATTLVYDVSFNEAVSGVASTDFTITGTATGCSIDTLTGSAAAYVLTLTGCSEGTVIVTFAADGATDTAGNTGPTSDASLTVTVDRTAPTATIDLQAGSDTGTSSTDNNTNAASLD